MVDILQTKRTKYSFDIVISMKFVPKKLSGDKSSEIQEMNWCRTWDTYRITKYIGARFTIDFFAADLNSMDISPCCDSIAGHQIATKFAHGATAQQSYHVQNFISITVFELRKEWNEISIEFELRWKSQ